MASIDHQNELTSGNAFSPLTDPLKAFLSTVEFTDPQAAQRCLSRLFSSLLPGSKSGNISIHQFLAHLSLALSNAADPDRVLVDIERFAQVFRIRNPGGVSSNAPDMHDLPGNHLFSYLERQPRAIEILVTLFAGSQFLAEILLRNPESFTNLLDYRQLSRPKSSRQFSEEASTVISPLGSAPEQLDALRRYQRQELLRIGYYDLLDQLDLPTVIRELSNLADALVQVCLGSAARLSSTPDQGFAVIALGKLGGQELNYSSDIDLLFIARSEPGNYRRLAESLIDSLARVTAEGFLYRVDMRLRPWGKDGSLVPSLDGYRVYLERHARQWEKQALLKSRFIAGDEQVAQEFLIQSLPMVLDTHIDDLRQDVHAMKQRTENFLLEQGRTWGEVKLGAGSIRDVEFIVQFLQLAHGRHKPDILAANTLLALDLLKEQKLLLSAEYRILREGYIFLRTVEHYLQMMHYQQVSTLPQDARELSLLAKRLGFQSQNASQLFLDRYDQHCTAIREVYLRYFSENQPNITADLLYQSEDRPLDYESPLGIHREESMETNTPDQPEEGSLHGGSQRSSSNDSSARGSLTQHLTRMDPSYAQSFTPQEIQDHAEMIRRLSENHLVEVEAKTLHGKLWKVVIVAYDYPGELSLICGLLYIHSLNIESGSVFTYEPLNNGETDTGDTRRKIVDVFRVKQENGENPDVLWDLYTRDLEKLLQSMQSGEHNEAFNQLTRRVALKMSETSSLEVPPLYPIDVTFDNSISENYTVLQITSQDTIGFLYELTSALAIRQIYIALVRVDSRGDRIFDTLYVTGSDGKKITDPQKQHELRSAIVLIKHFTHLLPHSANPERALLHFRGFIEKLQEQPAWTQELTSLERPEVLHALAEVLGVSDFMWEDFLRMQYENLYPVMRDLGGLEKPKTKDALIGELEKCLASGCKGMHLMENFTDPIYGAGWRSTVNAFKDRELFRVDMRNILGYTDAFDQFSRELTDLAEVIVQETIHLCAEELVEEHGIPLKEDGDPCKLAICALGKCGGRELGFASDVELMFIYSENGQTSGPRVISSAEYYEKLVQLFLSAIRTRREGIFHIDLQLRPYGKAGSLAVSLASFQKYFAPQGPAWAYERQALIRLRPIDGDQELSSHLLSLRDEYVYTGEPYDVTAMRAMRERQVRHIVAGGTFNAKYSPGGLLDIEYLVQGLQINHGHRAELIASYPDIRSPNTRTALTALARAEIINQEDYDRLRRALTFLRWLINTLRVVRGNARDLTVPPYGSMEFEYLTRRLRYGNDIQRLREELARFTGDVQEINQKLLVGSW